VNKFKYLSISIVVASIVLFASNVYRTEKQLQIINFEGSTYLKDAINLHMYKELNDALNQDEINDVKFIICQMILNSESELTLIKDKYDFTDTQLKIINRSLNLKSENCFVKSKHNK
jgi:hypothetical protein